MDATRTALANKLEKMGVAKNGKFVYSDDTVTIIKVLNSGDEWETISTAFNTLAEAEAYAQANELCELYEAVDYITLTVAQSVL